MEMPNGKKTGNWKKKNSDPSILFSSSGERVDLDWFFKEKMYNNNEYVNWSKSAVILMYFI